MRTLKNLADKRNLENALTMIRIRLFFLTLLTILLLLVSCKDKMANNEMDAARGEFVSENNLVDTMTLTRSEFSRELVSNGILKGVRRAELKFLVQGEIAKVYVKNGSYVNVGDPIVSLNTEVLQLEMTRALQALNKAKLDFKDRIISYGYGSDTLSIPHELVSVAKVQSGYSSAELNYVSASMSLRNAVLRAPFRGIVANLTAKPYEQSSGIVCMVIDNSSFDVEFSLLESEFPYIKVGQEVEVSPYIDQATRYRGTIKEINPFVDDRGQVNVVASVRGAQTLVEGMNVKIYLESKPEKMFVVPKSAVVMRDGYDVIFTLNEETMKAQWLYVDIIQSNSTQHAISGCLKKRTEVKEGSIIITSGNLNLADGSKVEIRK